MPSNQLRISPMRQDFAFFTQSIVAPFFALLSAASLVGCSTCSPSEGDWAVQPPIDHIDANLPVPVSGGPNDILLQDILTIEDYSGPALTVLDGPTVLWSEVFEDPDFSGLRIWSPEGASHDLSQSIVTSDGNRYLEVEGSTSVPAAILLDHISIKPYFEYYLHYRVRYLDFQGAHGNQMRNGSASFAYHSHASEEEWFNAPLGTPGTSIPRDFRPAVQNGGTTAWQEETVGIRPPRGRSYGGFFFSFSVPQSGKSEDMKGTAKGSIALDDLQVIEVPSDWVRAHQVSNGHPRTLRLTAPGPDNLQSTRDALHAPTGSSWTKRILLPEEAQFDSAILLQPDGTHASRNGAYRFSLVVDGIVEAHWDQSLTNPKHRQWFPVAHDLSHIQPGEHTITLRVEAIDGARPLDTLAWSGPRIFRKDPRTARTVVLVVIDTLGNHRLGHNGGREGVSPILDQMAREGTVFRQAWAAAPWTLASTSGLLTGFDPDSTGTGDYRPGDRSTHNPTPIHMSVTTLAERLQANGWDTEAALSNPFLHRRFNTDQGFRRFTDFGSSPDQGQAAVGIRKVLEWLDRPTGGDRFFYVHLLDPHIPYRAPRANTARFVDPDYQGTGSGGLSGADFAPFVNRKKKPSKEELANMLALHDAEIHYTDEQVGRLMDALRKQASETLVIVTSDHGEEFWEHESVEHGHTLYPEVLGVPLIFWGHGIPSQSDSNPVSILSVPATILEWAKTDVPADIAPSLFEPIAARASIPYEAVTASHLLYGDQRFILRQGDEVYIYNVAETRSRTTRAVVAKAPAEYYDLSTDPAMYHNRIESIDVLPIHRKLLPKVAASMDDRIVVVVVPQGTDDVPIEVEVLSPSGVGQYMWDYIAPAKGSSDVPRTIDVDPREGIARARTTSRLAMFGIHAADTPDKVEVRVRVAGGEAEHIPVHALDDIPPNIGESPGITAFWTPAPPWNNQVHPMEIGP